MGRRRPRNAPAGRKARLLEPGVHAKLVNFTRAGVPVALAANAVGVSERAFHDWLTRGRAEEDRQGDGLPPDPIEVPYHRLYREVLLARSQAGARNVGWLQKAAEGGYVTERTVEKKRDGTVIETEKIAGPDWRAAAWYLERQHRAYFGKEPTQVELFTGSAETAAATGGGELDTDAASALAARVGAAVAAAQQALPVSREDYVQDAEVVE